MIKYRLVCDEGHLWEGWFQNSDAYDLQVERKQVCCPECGTLEVTKAIMAPSIVPSRSSDAAHRRVPQDFDQHSPSAQDMREALRRLRDEVRASADYVGPRFAEEARRIHDSKSPQRGIYGEASLEEAKSLAEDGIGFLPLPRLPEDLN